MRDVSDVALVAVFVVEGWRRHVGREALMLACMLETGAASFRPGKIAVNWTYCFFASYDVKNVVNDVLLLCNVLEGVSEFVSSVEAQLGFSKGTGTKAAYRRTDILKAGVSVPKLEKSRSPVVESGSEQQLATDRTPV